MSSARQIPVRRYINVVASNSFPFVFIGENHHNFDGFTSISTRTDCA